MFSEVQHKHFPLNLVVSWLPGDPCCPRLPLPSVNWKKQKGAQWSLGARALAEGELRLGLHE